MVSCSARLLFLSPILLLLMLAALACNLGASEPVPTPSVAQTSFNTPTLGLSPVVGAPGTIITVSAAGFPAGTTINLFLSTVNKPSTVPVTQLTITPNGTLTFPLQLPETVNNERISNNTPLVFTLVSVSGSPGASALFLALIQNNLIPATPTPGVQGGINDLYITAPSINSFLAGTNVIVTGSGSGSSNTVTVQLIDSSDRVWGSANTVIQASSGFVGPWETTLGFQQPVGQTAAFIVAFTPEGKRASIPVTLSGVSR